MKPEIEIPSQYVEILKEMTAKRGISADEIVEAAIRKFLERSMTNAE